MRIGFLINPIAGMGGKVGLKGTDNVVQKAIEMGAKPSSPDRALIALLSLPHANISELLVYGSSMGEEIALKAGFNPTVVGYPQNEKTSAIDTQNSIQSFVSQKVDLILFAGGDGTAVDISHTLDELQSPIPLLGIPSGVKVYSSVFANSPQDVGSIISSYSTTELREVMDLDEDAYRQGKIIPHLHSIRPVPLSEELQSSKQLLGGTVEGAIEGLLSELSTDVTYILGPGGTLHQLKKEIGFEGTLLGVDIWRTQSLDNQNQSISSSLAPRLSGTVIAKDANESDILSSLTDTNIVIVSPIGGQGFIFGRGNGQISPSVLEHCTIKLVGSRAKLETLDVLRVDTGDPDIDSAIRGWHRIHIGRFETRLIEVV